MEATIGGASQQLLAIFQEFDELHGIVIPPPNGPEPGHGTIRKSVAKAVCESAVIIGRRRIAD
jgi:hypothetical protein